MRSSSTHCHIKKFQKIVHFLSGLMLFLFVGLVHAQDVPGCGYLENGYGPLDYLKASKDQIKIVEKFHFTPKIENLIPGRNADDYFGGDINYTLRAFPNHHRALITIQRLAEREKTDSPSHAEFSVACYFDRAIRFQPADPIVRMLFASYLIKKSRKEEATRQLDMAIKIAGDEPFTHFNVGIVFLDMKNYERALKQAHRAAELGFTRTELKDRLVTAGKWVEPPPPVEIKKQP